MAAFILTGLLASTVSAYPGLQPRQIPNIADIISGAEADILSATSGFIPAASTIPQASTDPNPWQAPASGDERAPCPGISTLANHGYINRSGKNITAEMLQQGFLDAFNIAFDVTDAGAQNTVNLCTAQLPSGSPSCTEFDLSVLAIPHSIEHDGSLTREDKGYMGGTGDNVDFNQTILEDTLAIWGGATHIDFQLSETARLRRFEQQAAIDDPMWFQENDGGSLTEHGFFQSTMSDPLVGDPAIGNARSDWIQYWWENQRLPTDIGWVKPTTVISQTQIASITNACQAASTIPATTTTAAAKVRREDAPAARIRRQDSQVTDAPSIPFNPYTDVQEPDVWSNLIGSVDQLLGDIGI